MNSTRELQPERGWVHAAAPRLRPPPPSERGLLFRSVTGGARLFGRKELPDLFPVFHINRRLFWPWLFFASRLMPGGRLKAKEREKIILRTGWNCRCRYEWGQHVEIGLGVGLSDQDILRVSKGPAHAADDRERALLLACDDMAREQCISSDSWAALAAHYSEPLLIEITILIGHYQMVAGFLNSTGIALEPAIEQQLQEFHRRLGMS
ncbi:carboxymuconolactone decarboxylase family protein [Solimonas sp. K1W22B-7]|uniref:carboxymuconolactone decarboxylase family protein n=1 Tax=Solimonas sp. K1W22B-7 TaxID=2303331 RepID=UPI000E334FD2|nr:carboxymuconolactone decarboxylase family protein [Solimonas sp. K1W22B-7]AXQ30339.1 carboxymuconolactone decarboxylase family protein [Solimonas sp. K1W22B-7]